ncbi:hypothetical protein BDY21DRAFT_350599 [Lineolata rhizophorae]|uniref:E3 ubiquitin-protein ligase listerin n=1 Tax=Lineolata rhizophorae TaxID=578093 RepID=A0A6A6NV95_9PEZI|nr:hypothetical protein BDY21DRAFT_350599 [Lineolata rhizophorae]
MSKRQFKAQASSSRAAFGAFGAGGFGAPPGSAFGKFSSQISYVAEPPDLSGISDPNTVVAFKNLSKKDSTTKAKALEDLQAIFSTSGANVEEAVLEAWMKIYPRISIDTSRRVRQLAHSVHGQISSSCGKRIAKFMPKIVGAWLCGLYDSDRSVSRAAQEAFEQLFPTPEKRRNVRKAFQEQILEYCRSIVDNETPQTLSDERTVSPDEASGKYWRVIASTVSVVASLLTDLDRQYVEKHQPAYEALLQDEKLWNFVACEDAAVRRSTLGLLRVCVHKQKASVESSLSTLSSSVLSKALGSDQTGSSLEYIDTLIAATKTYPQVWTDHYKSKKSASQRLKSFVKRGSQGAPQAYWKNLTTLFNSVPRNVLPSTPSDAVDLLNSARAGIIRREELRVNIPAAYGAYIDIANIVVDCIPENERAKVQKESLLPLVSQFIKPSPENAHWSIPGSAATTTVAKAVVANSMPVVIAEEWPALTAALVEEIKAKSEDPNASVTGGHSVVDQVARWASLQATVIQNFPQASLQKIFAQESARVLGDTLALVKTKRGDSALAAAALSAITRNIQSFSLLREFKVFENLVSFLQNELQEIFLSPSVTYLAEILYCFVDHPVFEKAWESCLNATLSAPDSPRKDAALDALLTSSSLPKEFKLAASNTELQQYLLRKSRAALDGGDSWDFVSRILGRSQSSLVESTSDEILAELTDSLSLDEKTYTALHGLDTVAKQNPAVLGHFLPSETGAKVLPKVLFLAESGSDDVSHLATSVSASLKSILSKPTDGATSKESLFDVVRRGLVTASSTSLSIATLVDLASGLWNEPLADKKDVAERLLPEYSVWMEALELFLAIPPKPSLAVTNSLGGAIYLALEHSGVPQSTRATPRDVDGLSPALRIAEFTVSMMKQTEIFDSIDVMKQAGIYRLLLLTVQLVNDNLGLAGSNNIWSTYNPDMELEMMELATNTMALITSWFQESQPWWFGSEHESSFYSFVKIGNDALFNASTGLSPTAFHNARAYSTATSELIELHGWQQKKSAEMENEAKRLARSKDVFSAAAFITAFKVPLSTSSSITRLCNEYVADLTGVDISAKEEDALRKLVLLNAIIQNQEEVAESIAKQRLIFFVKHVLPWLQEESMTLSVRSEVYKCLAVLLPLMKDIYGDHWTEVIESITMLWSSVPPFDSSIGESFIPAVHASLKLFATLRMLAHEDDANDDLVDAWKDASSAAANGLIHVLKQSQNIPDEFHQPLNIVNELLARHVAKMSFNGAILDAVDPTELFPLMYVASLPVQQTAFDILHKIIPAAQEQVSLDAALEKKDAQLPEELLSLIMEAPTMKGLEGATWESSIPLPLRGYLLSWLLVFDHFEGAVCLPPFHVCIDILQLLIPPRFLGPSS